ncbi:MAG: helix-turn-helix transcriptional regulator [Kofleriaceae bacterium]|nr:helix-turn-helix transcriptional regulator [Kofleriaceae bacterium]
MREATISPRARALLADWEEELSVVRLGQPAPASAPVLREVVDVDVVLVVRVAPPGAPSLFEDSEVVGVRAGFVEELGSHYSGPEPAAMFDFHQPQPQQRNRALVIGRTDQLADASPVALRRLGIAPAAFAQRWAAMERTIPTWKRFSLMQHHQLRVLVCDGPALVGVVTVMSVEPLRPVQLARFRSMGRRFMRRRLAEARLKLAQEDAALLATALDLLPGPAFVVGPAGKIELANVVGLTAARDRRVQEVARAAAAGVAMTGVRVTAVADRGRRCCVVELAMDGAADRRLAVARAMGLTERQCQVLRHLLQGAGYRRIAVQLAISERTVEQHVSAVLARLGVASVAEALLLLHQRQHGTQAGPSLAAGLRQPQRPRR